jgi:hypothetical protein
LVLIRLSDNLGFSLARYYYQCTTTSVSCKLPAVSAVSMVMPVAVVSVVPVSRTGIEDDTGSVRGRPIGVGRGIVDRSRINHSRRRHAYGDADRHGTGQADLGENAGQDAQDHNNYHYSDGRPPKAYSSSAEVSRPHGVEVFRQE